MDRFIRQRIRFGTRKKNTAELCGRMQIPGLRPVMLILVICLSCTGISIASGYSLECPVFPNDYVKCQDSPGSYQWTCLKDDALNCGSCGLQCDGFTEKCTGGKCVEIVKLTPSFTVTPADGCAPLQVTFKYNIQTSGGISQWYYDFGDGEHDTYHSPTHVYKKTGTFSPSLTVTNVGGKSATYTATNAISVDDCTLMQLANPPPHGGHPCG